jgi:tetratricopeptide (TPR) repeat protein
VGREVESAQLDALLHKVIDESEAAGLVVIGPPGIGKSRLRRALVADLPSEVVYLEGRGEANRTFRGWHAVATALRLHLELPEGSAPAQAQAALLAAAPTRACAEFLGEIVGAEFPQTEHLETARADPAIMRDRIVMAFGDLVESLTERAAVLLVIEDLHWADRPSLELCTTLLRRLERRPFFLLATARPELDLELPELGRLVLSGVSRQATRTLVESLLGDDAAAEAIHDRSGGNPYFVEELALALREGRKDLPASVEAAVQARLDALGRREKDLLRRASVLGRRFWAEALVAMGESEPAVVLGRLRRRDLVTPEVRPRLAGTTEWRFRHAIVQEVAYSSLTAEQREGLHHVAGRWLAERPDASVAEVARHLETAGRADEAAPFWLRAAEAASRAGDAPLALEAAAKALDRPTEPGAAFRLRLLRAEVLTFLGRGADEAAEIEALASAARTDEERAIVHERRALHMRRRGRFAEAAEEIAKGLALARRSVPLLVGDAMLRSLAGRPVEALDPSRAALEAAHPRGQMRGRALEAHAHCLVLVGDVGSSLPVFEEAVAIYDVVGDPRRSAGSRANLAYCQLLLGRYEEAEIALDAAREACRAAGNRVMEGYALHNLGLARARSGRVEEGLAAEAAAQGIAAETDQPRLGIGCRMYRAVILLEAGRPAEALETIDAVLETPEETLGNAAPELRTLRAAALLASSRAPEARREAERAMELREAAGGMEEFEAELALVAHAAGIDGALAAGLAALRTRADKISDPALRASFLERVPAHARLVAAARAAGIA